MRMLNTRRFLRKLFSCDKKCDKPQTSKTNALSIRDKAVLQETLKSQYGLEITSEVISLSDIESYGYRKMLPDEVARVSTVFQYAPQIVTATVNSAAIRESFKTAIEGSYRVRLTPGTHLAASRLTPGAFRGVGLDNMTNKVGTGNPELFANDAILSISSGPQIALDVFNAVSFVTGQYFMSQVNGKLTEIKSGMGRIEQFLDAVQKSKLKAALQEMNDIYARLGFINLDSEQIRSTIEQIHTVQRTAQESIIFCKDQIDHEINVAKREDKEEEVKIKLDSIGKYALQYRCAVQLYSVATLMEIQLRNVFASGELDAYYKQIEVRVSQYKSDYKHYEAALKNYLDVNRVLNDRSIWQNFASIGTGIASIAFGGIGGVFHGVRLAETVDDVFNDGRKNRKAERVKDANQIIEQLSDMSVIDSPCNTISDLIDIANQQIDIVLVDGDYYTNLPTAGI